MTVNAEPDELDDEDEEGYKYRRGRGFLAGDVNRICRAWTDGDFTLPEGKFMTPYFIAKLIKEIDVIDKPPSMGAITRVLHKWEDIGYATCRTTPFAFEAFTETGMTLGFVDFMEQQKKPNQRESK